MKSRPRVLLVGPELILGWTESTARALQSLGCAVTTIFYNRSHVRQGIGWLRRSFTQRWGLGLPQTPAWLQVRCAAWSSARAGLAMVRTARAFRPDLVLILKGESLHPFALQELKAATGAPVVVWWVDHPFMNAETQRLWPEVSACVPLYDACFIFDRSYEADLRAAGARTVHLLPCAADPEIFTPLRLTSEERAAYGAAMSLIGVYTESRARVVEALCGVPGLGVWGPGWEQFLAGREGRDPQAFRGQGLSPADACKVYNASLVNLNTHHHQSRDAGVNTRAFEILAAGAFELTDHVPGMAALLEPGREVAVYRTPEEAVELARYYVKADEERRRIAEAGHRRVLAEHTYRHRMQTLLDAVVR